MADIAVDAANGIANGLKGLNNLPGVLNDAFDPVDDWFITAGGDIASWFKVSSFGVKVWSEGALNDIGTWTVNAATNIRDWNIDIRDLGENVSDVFDRMGQWKGTVLDEIDDLTDKIGDWGISAVR